jgi:hypothetical protein
MRLRLRIRWLVGQSLFLEYSGRPEDLLAAGAASPEMLEPGQGGGRGLDSAGDFFAVTRETRTGRVVVSRWKSASRAAAMPGVAALVDAQCDDALGDHAVGRLVL